MTLVATLPGRSGWRSTGWRRKRGATLPKMPRRPASIVQSDIARIIRAAKQAGACEVSSATDSAVVASIAPQHGVSAATLGRASLQAAPTLCRCHFV